MDDTASFDYRFERRRHLAHFLWKQHLVIATVEQCPAPRSTGVELKIQETLTGPPIAQEVSLPHAKCLWPYSGQAYPFEPGSVALYALVREGQPAYFDGRALDFLKAAEVESVLRRLRELRAFWDKPEPTKRALLATWLASDITQLQDDALTLISNLDGIEEDPRRYHSPTLDAPLTKYEWSTPIARSAGSWTKRFLLEILNLIRPSTDYDVMRKALRMAELEIQGDPDHAAFPAYVTALEREAGGETPERVRSAMTRLDRVK